MSQSRQVRSALFNRLAIDLKTRFKIEQKNLMALDNQPITRFVQDLGGYKISPHPDISEKHVTMQIYLPENIQQRMLGTTIYQERWGAYILYWRKQLRILPRAWRSKLFLRKVKTFPFMPNSGYAFAVSSNSWHGRSKVPNWLGFAIV